jgi:hypothetical protein
MRELREAIAAGRLENHLAELREARGTLRKTG